jgi:asparagine synthase (glutamine-hydrolysing)
MCGIAGFLDRRGVRAGQSLAVLERMAGCIAHRGPDGNGTHVEVETGVGLAHRRLAIIDLTETGKQPMESADGRWVAVFNGEIYNFERLRATMDAEAAAPAWRGHSDTEVLLEAVSRWGVEAALQAAIGMFAIALWDRAGRILYLARDRAGEKPLYYGSFGNVLLFGSELKSLRAHPDFQSQISRPALGAYLRYGYVPAPHSIYQNIYKVEPGCLLAFVAGSDEPRKVRYWQPPRLAPDPALSDTTAAARVLEDLLTDAIGLQMRADVPMGAFLSGGVDSSVIVSLMQSQSMRSVKTFSIGFEEAEFNEAPYAAEVAAHLGTDHHEMYVTPRDALDVVPLLPAIYDEPFADSSQIPTYLLSKLTREHVTVSLSGDAGDELFGGYTRYFQSQQFERLWKIPAWMRAGMASALMGAPGFWQRVGAMAPAGIAGAFTAGRIPKIAAALESRDIYEVYRRLVSQWKDPSRLLSSGEEPSGWLDDAALRASSPDVPSWMMAVDFRTYLPDDILVKVDRASMAVSLESRVPFLDHRVIEFAARLPLDQKIRGGVGKRLLRDVLYRHVPRSLIERPKQGFGVPIGAWLRGPLRAWADDLLNPARLEADGLLNVSPIRAAWERHQSGAEDLHYQLWTILMFQAWRRDQAVELRAAA